MQTQTRGEFGGLGLEVTMENGVVKVVSPIDDTPAAKAGLLANDLITHIDGEQIVGLTLEQAVEKMRGPVNTPITLTIVRKGVNDPFDVKVMRDIIRINPVKAHNEGDVAYIKVTPSTSRRIPTSSRRSTRPRRRSARISRATSSICATTPAACSIRPSPFPTTSSRMAQS